MTILEGGGLYHFLSCFNFDPHSSIKLNGTRLDKDRNGNGAG